jgi:thiamine biosynthesis lipoprotein
MKIGSLVKNKILIIALVFVLIVISNSCNTSENSEVFTYSGSTMGTTYSVKVASDNIPPQYLQTKIDSVLEGINKEMSTYISDSEISLFNSSTDTGWIDVSKDLTNLINNALEIAAETDYVYDITIGPVVNLWGFGPGSTADLIPSDDDIIRAKSSTGINKLIVDTLNFRIKKTIPDLYCDLSSIAKGFGVDKVGLILEEHGYNNYMVEIGGEVRTSGYKKLNEKWRIGISTPLNNDLQKILSISDISVATSGDYLNYFEKNGIRYSHLIDPRNGKPIKHNLASVTVLAGNCKTADQ